MKKTVQRIPRPLVFRYSKKIYATVSKFSHLRPPIFSSWFHPLNIWRKLQIIKFLITVISVLWDYWLG